MKTVIDNLISSTGWTVSSSTVTADTWPMFSSSHLGGQLKFIMALNGTAAKTVSVATAYENIGFNIVCKDNDGSTHRLKVRIYNTVSPAVYKEYYVPLSTQFVQVKLKNYYANVAKIEFIAVAAVDFFICEMINYTDQIPYDLYLGVLNKLRNSMETMPQIGVVSCAAGATSVTITSARYLDKYLTVKIGSEIHQIDGITQGKTVTFTAFGAGKAMAGTFAAEPVYLYLPTEIEPGEYFIFEPGFSFTEGFPCVPVQEEEYYSVINDSYETSGINRTRRIGPYFQYTVRIQSMARHGKIGEILLRVLKKAFASADYVWINGQKHEAEIPDGIQQQPNGDGTDIENVFFADVKIIASEEIWPEQSQTTAELAVTKTVSVITT